LRRFNILVGPNNAGKSTVLIAFRILASGLRRATTRRAELGVEIAVAAILDRDYRSDRECSGIVAKCGTFCVLAAIHESKEIENFVLISAAIDRAAAARLNDRARRGGKLQEYEALAAATLDAFAASKRSYVVSQCLTARRDYERGSGVRIHDATLSQQVIEDVDRRWADPSARMRMIPGKEALSHVNQALQERYGVSVTANAIVDAMRAPEVPTELSSLLERLDRFASGALER
jgi:hypothetical protein